MSFTSPHIWMHIVWIQSITICLLLCIQHYGLKVFRHQESVFTRIKYTVLKQETGINITDCLCGIHQEAVKQCQFLFSCGFCNSEACNMCLIKSGSRLCYLHRIFSVQNSVCTCLCSMICMSQFMCQSIHSIKGTVEVRQYSALSCMRNLQTVSSSDLSFMGIKVNPFFIKCTFHHIRHVFGKYAETVDQTLLCFFQRVLFLTLAKRCQHLEPWQSVMISQILRLCTHIFMEYRQIFLHSAQHGIQCLFLHMRLIQCHRQC